MSLKDNVDYVRKEISGEEKFLESSVKAERFFKKYKVLIISSVVVAVVATVAVGVSDYLKTENKKTINIAFNKVLKDSKDKQSLELLKQKSKTLYQMALYIEAGENNKIFDTDLKFLKELTAYSHAINANDIDALNSVSMKNNFLLKEFAIFNKALILSQNGKYKEAKATLKLIKSTSSVKDLVQVLDHYLLTK